MYYETVDFETALYALGREYPADNHGGCDFGKCWQHFFASDAKTLCAAGEIPVGIYKDFDSDFNGKFTFSVGTLQNDGGGKEDFKRTVIPAGRYCKFKAADLKELQAVWAYVWGSKLDRTYVCDFEKYLSDGAVEIYVGIKSPALILEATGLFVTDIERSVKFYRDVMGMTTAWSGTPNAELFSGNFKLIMFPRTDFEKMTAQGFGYAKGISGMGEIAFATRSFTEVDKEYERVVRLGAAPVLKPTTEPWGQRTSYVADPDGNLIEISSFNNDIK